MKITSCPYRPILVPCGLENFDYQVDPYVGCQHYCYYCYVLNQAETDWKKEIRMHKDVAGQLKEELKKITPQTIYMGYYSDPYQPCEAEYCQTRKVLELFLEKGFSVSILTKSDLILRDVDVLQKLDYASVSVSVAFNDNLIRRQFEARTMDTEVRIAVLRKLRAAGIRTAALICPVIPYITDAYPLLDMLAPHTEVIWIYGLSFQARSDRNWQNIQGILNSEFPDLKEKIEAVVFSREHSYWKMLRKDLLKIQKEKKLNLNIHV